jgi:polyferredoxin
VVGRFLKWQHSRTVMQVPLFALAALMVWHGLTGPQVAPRNVSTVLTWVHYRGALVLALLVAGNLFCMACPFMLPRNLARRFVRPVRQWPAALRNKWVAVALFVALLFSYEAFDLWDSPWWTAWIIVAYFTMAVLVDSLFANAPFCKYVCPLGQFNFVASTVSPLELKVTDHDVCASCETRPCINGTRDQQNPIRLTRRGCELALFQPQKRGNMDCTLCLDCVHACPYDNIQLTTRLPASELWSGDRRSGVGFFERRKDIAVLAVVFTFGALLNAFGMVSPMHHVQMWLSGILGTSRETPVLGTLFFFALIVEPVVLLAIAGLLTRRAVKSPEPLLPLVTRFAYALVPLGFSIWLAHYSFHALSGLLTFIPVMQDALGLGTPAWHLRGVPPGMLLPLEYGLLALGVVGSLLVAHRIAARDYPDRARLAFAPWATLILVLGAAAVWLMAQPMQMRGMMMSMA